MQAQILYDWREQSEDCSGTELHKFFAEQTGDPSPSGRVEIDNAAAEQFMVASKAAADWNMNRR